MPALDSAVLSVTGFNAGQAYNVIPDQVTLKGTVRAFKVEMMRLVEDRMRAVVQGTAAAFGASAEITFQEIAAPTINAPIEATALADPYFAERKLYPNVDFYSGIVYKAIGIPVSMFTALFAVARTVGWIAQWNEMVGDPEQKIARPRQLFTGSPERNFVPLDKRK